MTSIDRRGVAISAPASTVDGFYAAAVGNPGMPSVAYRRDGPDASLDVFFAATVFEFPVAKINASNYLESDAIYGAAIAATANIGGAVYNDTDTIYSASVAGTAIIGSLYPENDALFSAAVSSDGGISGGLYSDSDAFYSAVAVVAAGFTDARSLLFTAASSQYLSRAGNASANTQKLTISFLWKRSSAGSLMYWFEFSDGTALNNFSAYFDSTNHLVITGNTGGVAVLTFITNAQYPDTASWHHGCIGIDTTQATPANRFKLEIDGSVVASFSTATYPALNQTLATSYTNDVIIGANRTHDAGFYDGRFDDVYIIDGQKLDHTSFVTGGPGVAKAFSGNYTGVADSALLFEDSASTTTLGANSSGEGNNWTLHAMTTANSSDDTPSNRQTLFFGAPFFPVFYNGTRGAQDVAPGVFVNES